MPPRGQPIDQALAQTIKRLREERQATQEAVALDAGLTLSAYWRIESGLAGPAWITVRQIAEALDVSLEELGRLVERE